ncbi:hypothetical protein [Fibrella forsythiae]|uniref:Uncharacterized protein n=1 Tax=Fibrella forsythiae TaxID=2817061 RepID=A0ABS3JFM9_9BACT|nr:hypothetical protein [Fibrella forsythiae]MBO0948238.1 hypothetical protein [Fibrella forsythiae]
MKYVLIGFLLCLSVVCRAQHAPNSIRKQISDDEKTLSIRIDGIQNGQPVHVDQSFDVSGMNQLQKEWLTFQAFRAQHIPVSIHEIRWLLILSLGVIALLMTLLIIVYQTQRAAQMSAVKGF